MSADGEIILSDLVGVLRSMTDWEFSGEVTRETRFFADLGFESIDAVALGDAIEAHYRQRFPYAQFLAEISEREERDIRLGEVVDFLRRHLDGVPRQGRLESAT
jgi:acyl carrier protein